MVLMNISPETLQNEIVLHPNESKKQVQPSLQERIRHQSAFDKLWTTSRSIEIGPSFPVRTKDAQLAFKNEFPDNVDQALGLWYFFLGVY